MEEFGERFVRENIDVIDVGDMRVHQRLVIPQVGAGRTLSVTFERYSEEIGQAVCVSTAKGKLQIGEERAARFILWADHSPVKVDLQITNRVPSDIVLWNAWRRHDGGVDAALRYAGMLVESVRTSVWHLRCSDGIGSADFDDLVLRVELR
ncbi:hypothetical protein AB0I60_37130 [Actinosynnema sp. NPDC050436]|uniref:hypothetical protein n=1 Tax=Actinosynnema sp. NPDC050436 TaxID=3155659 RepID=UPI0033F19FA7